MFQLHSKDCALVNIKAPLSELTFVELSLMQTRPQIALKPA